MKKSRVALILIIIGAFGISALSLLLPKPADVEQKALMSVYLSVEHQLLTDDKLRSFTKEGLRADAGKRFGLDNQTDRTFWPMLQG